MGGRYSMNLFSVLIVISLFWNQVFTEDACSIGCKGSQGAPSFLNNHKYNYAVEGVVSVFLTGADQQETSVKLSGQASVAALGNCAYVLRLPSLQISGPDGKKYKSPPGIEKPVRFTLEDGKVGSEICSEEEDTRRSLNIKRAIISLLQSPVKQSTETDVFGICPTQVSSSQEGGAVLLHRSRDLSRCGMREQGRNDLITGVFDPHAEIKNTQVLQSTLNIETKVKNGVPEKVSATEDYLYKPFSVGQNGARAKVHTKLSLTGQSGGTDEGKFTQVRTIIFENPHGVKLEQSNLQSATKAFKDTTAALQQEANSKSAGEFAQFVRILRLTSKEDLMKLYGQAKGNPLGKRVFLDGLLRAGTGASIEVAIQILKNKELDEIEQKLVYLSLGNAKHVTNEALKAAASLLDVPNIPKEVYLGVGALGGAFCRSHQCHGPNTQSKGLSALSQKLAGKLHNCKSKNKVEEDYVVAALKGLRSFRHIESTLVDRLVHCVSDKTVKPRVKVAALEAFHADPCVPELKKVAIETMKNRQLDSELRIKAYLAIIDCPCAKSATEIKNLLETEPVHQVGRFISSSLRHIRSSANPDKALARQHYGLIRTPNKFEVDDRKYSFYREGSYDIDTLGVGGNVEQTVIFSQDSFVPRSASVNLTAQLFGHSLNVLEVGGRQGNLDRVIEHFLGPKSFLREQSPQEIYDNLKKTYGELSKTVEEKMRRKRHLGKDIDAFDKQVKAEVAPYDNELDLDIYIKLFGVDAVFLSLGDDKGFDANNVLKEIMKFVDGGMNKAKNFQQEVRGHMLFLDAELAYPTSTGFALKLDLVGSATGRFEVSSKVDVRQIFKDPKNAKIDIKLVPSTDIEIAGLFLVDADSVATGLKVVTNFHTSTGGHLIAKLIDNAGANTHGIDIQFGLPIDKQEILHAHHDLVFVTREKGQKEKEVALKIDMEKKDYSGCFDQLSKVLGLTFCAEVSMPFSVTGQEAQSSIQKYLTRFPLTGPAKVKVHLEKNDLRGYHLKYLFHNNAGKQGFELLFEAEGGQNRKTSLTGELVNTSDEKRLTLSLQSPIQTAQGEISLLMKPNEYVALIKGQWDAEQYYGKAGFTIQGNNKRSVYKPILEFQIPKQDKNVIKVDGQIVKEVNGPSTKFSLEGIKINMPKSNDVVDIDGFYVDDKKSINVALNAKKGDQNGSLKGKLINKDFQIEFTNTLNPHVNFKLIGKSDNNNQNHHYQNDFDLLYGQDLKSDKQRITFNQLLKFNTASPQDFNFITKNKLAFPLLALVAKANAEIDPKKVDIEIEGKYAEYFGELEAKARTNIKHPGDYNVKLEAQIMDKGIEIVANRDIVDNDKSNFENSISMKGVGKYELSGVVTHKIKTNDVNIGANGHLKLRSGKQQHDIKFDFGLTQNPSSHTSHLKLNTDKTIVNYILTINRGPSINGKLDLTLLDDFTTNGNFKMNEKDGKGTGGFEMHFKKADKKFKGDLKFVVKDPVFNADVDLFLNFGKDNNDKVHLSTNNMRTEHKVETKNKFVYGGKTTEFNLSGKEEEPKTKLEVELILPNEQVVSFKFDRHSTNEGPKYVAEEELVLSHFPQRNQEPAKLSYSSKWEYDSATHITHIEMKELRVVLKDKREWVNKFFVKNNPIGEKKFKAEFKNEMTGSLMPAPFLVMAFINHDNDRNVVDGPTEYQVKISYGDYKFNLDGKADIALTQQGDKKYFNDFTATATTPLEKLHEMKWSSNILFLIPENKDVVLEYTFVQAGKLNSDEVKFDANGKIGKHNGFSKVKLLIPNNDPFSLDTSYKNKEEGTKTTGEMEIKTVYGKGKTANIQLIGTSFTTREYSLEVKAAAPQAEKLKKLEFSIHTKNPNPETFSVDSIIDMDGSVHKANAIVVYSKDNPLMDIKYSCPNKPESRIFLKGHPISSTHGKIECKVENIREINIDVIAEGQFDKDNIMLKSEGNAEKLGLKNYNVKISSKDAGNGKRLEFNVENDKKNIVSGSTSFMSKEEGSKTLLEGSGSVKVNNQQKSATFKYIRTIVSDANEQGVENFMNAVIGERSYVAEFRVTNLDFKASAVYCEEKKQCANVEINSKTSTQDKALQHTFNVGIDLRKLGITPEFGLQLKNEIIDQMRLQSALDIYLKQDNDKKYHMSFYNKPRPGANIGYDTGLSMELPSRILAAESSFSAGSKMLAFPINGEVAMYLDKKKPNQKLSANMHLDLIGSEKEHTFKADFKFHHPKLPKDTGVNVQTKVKHENFDNFMIEGVVSATNEGEAKIHFDVKPQNMKFLIQTPLVKVIEAEGTLQLKEKHQEAEFKFNLLEGKPVIMKAINKDFQYFEFTTGYSEDANRKLSIISHIEIDKRIDISADIVLNGAKKNIGHGALFIANDLLKSEHGTSKENFEYFVRAVKGDLDRLQERVKQLADKSQVDMKKRLDRYKANLKKVEDDYKQELEKLKHELINDKTLQDMNKAVNDVVHFVASIMDDIVRLTASIATTINKAVTETWDRAYEVFNKEIKPQLEKIYSNWAAVAQEYMNIVVDLVAHFGAIITDFVEKHKGELKELTDIVTDIFKSLTRLLIDRLTELRSYATTIFNEVMQQLKEMPLLAMIKDKYNEFSLPERLTEWVNEIYQALQTVLPTNESKELAKAIVDYMNKKIHQKEKVNDEAELRNIHKKLVAAFSSVFDTIKQQLKEIGIPTNWNFNFLPNFASPGQTWPTFGARPSFSVFNELLTGDFPDLLQYIRTYRPRSLNPLDEIPSKLRAVVVNGQHIFTFDGAHLTFPGSCYYVLAHDHIDRNFTLAIELANGAPKSIALTDKSGSVIEIKENGQVTLNGAKNGFPAIGKDIVGYRETNGHVGLRSRYGVIVSCTPNLSVCHFEVSGFYLGKLRGLLGDGNNEPFDDFRLPNGKIVSSQSEFGNAYRLQKSCAAAAVPEHNHHQFHAALPAACEDVFGAKSPLWPLSFLMNMAPFRQACIHAVAANSANAHQEACDLALGYTALARSGLLPAVMPPDCLKCSDADKPYAIGDNYHVKLPAKQADLILLVETTKGNEKAYKQLVQPLVASVLETLKQKKIDDVKVHLLGVTPQFPYPIIYDNEKSVIKFNDESRYKPQITSITFNHENIDKAGKFVADAINELSQIFGTTNVIAGYNRALQLPLRPQAVKHVISVVSEHCKKSFFLVEQARILSISAMYHMNAMSHTLVTVTPDLQLGGGKPVEQVIGFDSSSVLLLGDKKKGADSEQLRHQLTKTPDACVDFVEGINGLVLSATNFLGMNPGQQKQFVQTSGQVIADRMTKYTQQHSCYCSYVDGFQARSLCYREDISVSRRRK